MATPSTRAPTWATDGGADITDPGASKQADGWIESEAPAADHTNWILKNQGEAFDFLHQTLGGMIALGNIDRTAATPFVPSSGDIETLNIRYDSLAARWYCSMLTANTNDVVVYDSIDGITWNAGVDIDLAVATLVTISAPRSNGTNVGVATQDEFYLSTGNTVANMPAPESPTGTFTDIDRIRGLIWDDTNSLWIAAGDDFTTDGNVETSPAAGTTWTNRKTDATNLFTALAHDGAGNSVVSTDDVAGDTTIWISSDATSWAAATTPPTEAIDNVAWCPSLGLFAGISVTNIIWFSTDGNVWASAATSSNLPDIVSLITAPDFTVMFGVSGEVFLFPSAASSRQAFEYFIVGEIAADHLPIQGFDSSGRSLFEGGQGKFVYGDALDKLAVAQYKPPA